EAALFAFLTLVARPLDLRVDEGDQRGVLADAVHEQPLRQPDLRCRQPDAQGVVHQAAHARDLRAESVIETVDRRGPALQNRVTEAADERHSRGAARLGLRIPLLYLGLDLPGVLLELL